MCQPPSWQHTQEFQTPSSPPSTGFFGLFSWMFRRRGKKGREGDKFGGQSNNKKCSSNDGDSFETILSK